MSTNSVKNSTLSGLGNLLSVCALIRTIVAALYALCIVKVEGGGGDESCRHVLRARFFLEHGASCTGPASSGYIEVKRKHDMLDDRDDTCQTRTRIVISVLYAVGRSSYIAGTRCIGYVPWENDGSAIHLAL